MQPRDFLSDNEEQTSNATDRLPIDYLAEPAQENLVTSAALAIPRVGEDILKSGYNLIQNVPDFFRNIHAGLPSAVETIQQNPGGALKQGIAGLAEQGQNVFNLPHDFFNYLTNRLNLYPKNINELIQMARMPESKEDINQTFGVPQNKGEEFLRGLARNSLNLLGAYGAAKTLNPMRLNSNNIAKNVVNTRNSMMEKYSGPKGLYTNLFNEARNKGIGKVKYNPNKININAIGEYANPKYTESVQNFLNNPDIELAQKAQSDLKKYVTNMNKRTSLTSPEQKSVIAAKEAQNHLTDMMFKGQPRLKKRYNKITKGYKEEVIPYTTNNALNDFIRGDLLAEELIPKLSKGKFIARRGKFHPEIKIKKNIPKITKTTGALGAGLGLGFGGKELYDVMSNK